MGCWEADPLNYFCGKPQRLAGRVADTTYFGQRSSPLPTIPAPAIRRSGSKNISWYAKICYVFSGRVKFYSSPHLWLEQVLSLALQIKKSAS